MVLSVPIFWKIAIESLAVSFTFFGLIMLRTDLEEIAVQGFANLEKQVGVDPFVAEHLIQVLARAVHLRGQPSDASTLPHQFGLDEFPDVEIFRWISFLSFHSAFQFIGSRSLVPKSNRKGAHLSFDCLLCLMALVNRRGNKHEKVCAIKRKLFAGLFSRFKIYQIFQTENKSVKPVRLICQVQNPFLCDVFLFCGTKIGKFWVMVKKTA